MPCAAPEALAYGTKKEHLAGMPRAPETRIAKLTKVRALPQDGRYVLHYKTDDIKTSGKRCSTTFVSMEHVPAFEGEAAWFLMERVPATPWAYWKALRQVEPPDGKS